MIAHDLPELLAARRETSSTYLEFLRTVSMSAGIYELPEFGDDAQTPHGEDEIYYVLQGHASIRVGGEDRSVAPGSVIFVPARVEHVFHTIREPLSLLVVFAPAEGSRSTANPQSRRRQRSRPSTKRSSPRRKGRGQ